MQTDFISTVSHELRTPLTSIRGFADTLIQYKNNLSEEQKIKFLTNIKEQSDRLISLVENLLAAASADNRDSASDSVFVCKSVNVKDAAQKTITLLKQKYPRKAINIKISDNLPEILADGEKFEQILLNLLENACKYSFENSDAEISAINTGKEVEISVANDGLTIEDEDKAKVFEKFSRLDNPMTRLTQGSGIGLFLTKNITEKMGGRIQLESKEEHTVFTVVFPIATEENIIQCKLRLKKDA